jgi:hypothetical protein
VCVLIKKVFFTERGSATREVPRGFCKERRSPCSPFPIDRLVLSLCEAESGDLVARRLFKQQGVLRKLLR